MDVLEKAKLKLAKQQQIQVISTKHLHPPKSPKKELSKPIMIEDDFFGELAHSTEFKRFIYKVLYGKVHRTEKQHGNLDQKVKDGLEFVREVGRGNRSDVLAMRKELKEALSKRKTKIEG